MSTTPGQIQPSPRVRPHPCQTLLTRPPLTSNPLPTPAAGPKYEYLNVRKKPFPWGLQSLFFNPKAQYPAEL